jgi:hypothetical protein
MPKVVKVLLLLAAGGLVFLGALGIGGALWWKNNKARLMEGSAKAMEEGEAFGATHSDAECLDEAFRRLPDVDGLTGEVKNNLFFDACLKKGRETPGFCQDVPKPGDILGSVKWQLATCARRHHINDQRCSRALNPVQKHCAHTL